MSPKYNLIRTQPLSDEELTRLICYGVGKKSTDPLVSLNRDQLVALGCKHGRFLGLIMCVPVIWHIMCALLNIDMPIIVDISPAAA